jgi:hypothetical protein
MRNGRRNPAWGWPRAGLGKQVLHVFRSRTGHNARQRPILYLGEIDWTQRMRTPPKYIFDRPDPQLPDHAAGGAAALSRSPMPLGS